MPSFSLLCSMRSFISIVNQETDLDAVVLEGVPIKSETHSRRSTIEISDAEEMILQ